jgi:hypothetical protein
MSEVLLEEIAPRYVREKRFDLTLDAGISIVRAGASVVVNVSYVRSAPEGAMLPLLLEVQGPSPTSYQRRAYLRTAPASIVFSPREGGPHTLVLRELGHNKWFGTLNLDVEGELLEPPITV